MTRKPLFTSWLVRFDEDEAVFRRPFAERLFCGLLALGSAFLLGSFVVFAYHQRASGQNMLPLGLIMFFVIVSIFAFGAGPKEMRFDFQRRRWKLRTGFPLLAWIRTGSFDEIASISVWNTRFVGLAVKWKNVKRDEFTFFGCTNVGEAWDAAKRLEGKIGVPAPQGTQRRMKSR